MKNFLKELFLENKIYIKYSTRSYKTLKKQAKFPHEMAPLKKWGAKEIFVVFQEIYLHGRLITKRITESL